MTTYVQWWVEEDGEYEAEVVFRSVWHVLRDDGFTKCGREPGAGSGNRAVVPDVEALPTYMVTPPGSPSQNLKAPLCRSCSRA